MNKQSQTDWARIDALKDEEIDYSEIPDLGEDEAFWSGSKYLVSYVFY